ncbi:MAG: hypothetical protein A2113_03110 [Candidatus Woykebacteria bacterium GWA1_44_8]|uniref:Type II secretion system protein GspG C-terminal domain-containing protein n=1 Tax=Candidatus Woykebacteria bacterium GWA1_44_8 TaxID=1802591 RepID=A0A1G1W3P7_9BACT|nr:MAG: hypothetical protein A2113_03110 [Candidatus Woykebacteria bacterium GWA1_44_8]
MLSYYRKPTDFRNPLPRLNCFARLNPLNPVSRLNLFNPLTPLHLLRSSRGISIITLIILAAAIVAAFNAYAYFNPKFQLSKYSVVYLIHAQRDNQRKADLEKIKAAVEKYYDDNGQYPARDGWCGRIYSVFNPEVKDALSDYFAGGAIPRDPGFRETDRDYFYRRENTRTYVLMAALENLPADSPTYSYSGCHNWPGDDVYNYRLLISR